VPTDTRKLPNLIIAGIAKAGTSSLFRYLSQHPDICVSDVKEVGHFLPLRYGVNAPPLEAYAIHFQGCESAQYRLEATPGYFFGGRRVAAAIEETLDNPCIILSLRDPVNRFCSYYTFERSHVRIPRHMSLNDYLGTCERLRSAGLDGRKENNTYWALSGGFYADYLDDWLEIFGERLHIVFFEHLASNPASLVAEVCRWLHIDDSVVESFDYTASNKTFRHRSDLLQKLALRARERSRGLLRRHPALRKSLQSAYGLVNGVRRPAEHEFATQERLRQIYGPPNKRLANRLREHGYCSLPGWLSALSGEPPSLRSD
jgi:hypothetical protein